MSTSKKGLSEDDLRGKGFRELSPGQWAKVASGDGNEVLSAPTPRRRTLRDLIVNDHSTADVIGKMTAPAITAKASTNNSQAPKMNGLEKEYSQLLENRRLIGEIINWYFEPVKLRLAGSTFYKPDFMVVLTNGEIEFHETKGTWRGEKAAHWEDDARVKIKVAASMYPFRFMAASKKDNHWKYEQFKNC